SRPAPARAPRRAPSRPVESRTAASDPAASRPVESRSRASGWRWFFHAYEPRRAGTMPAGFILVLMVLTLAAAAPLHATATLRKSNAKDKGEWRQATAEAVEAVSGHLGLDRLRNGIDDARGISAPTDVTTPEQLLAAQQHAQQQAAAS